MKELYFKSFGYRLPDKTPVFGCLGLAVHYDDNLNVISCLSTNNIYRNLKNPEEAVLVAGLDLLYAIEKNGFVKQGEKLSFCITSGILHNYFDQYFGKRNYNQLLTPNQERIAGVFNNHLTSVKNKTNLDLSIALGISNRRIIQGLELLSKVEDELIDKLQRKVDVRKDWADKKRDLLDSEINELKVSKKVTGEELERMEVNKDFYTKGTSYDREHTDKIIDVARKTNVFENADRLLKSIKEDDSYRPRLQHYF